MLYFFTAINSYFSQDDFFHFRAIMDKSLVNVPSFFLSSQKDYAFYRPLTRETYNLVIYSIFKLNPFVFHLINFVLILLNGFLTYVICLTLTKKRFIAFLAVLIFLFSSVHSVELYYLSSDQTLFATTFVIFGFLSYINFSKSLKKRYYFLSILFFLLGLFSHESAVSLVPILIVAEFWLLRKSINLKTSFLRLTPFLMLVFLRFILHFFEVNVSDQSVYQMSLSPSNIFNTLAWFLLWSFGLPEMMVDFMTLRLKFNPNFFIWYKNYAMIIFPLVSVLFLISTGLLVRFWKIFLKDKIFVFWLLAYILSTLPFLFFPHHKFVYYLSLPLVFFSCFFATILSKIILLKKFPKILIVVALGAYIIVAYQTIKINEITYWAAKRANSAKQIVSNIKKEYPTVKKGTVFYIKNDPTYPFIAKEWGTSSKQAFYILSGSDAFKLIYNDPSINVYFEDNDILPFSIDQNIIVYVARFPY